MCQPVYDKSTSVFTFTMRSTGINVPEDKIIQTTLSWEKNNHLPLRFLSLETINVLKVLTLKVTFYIRKRNRVLAQLSSSSFLMSVDEEQKTLQWEVFGFASLISWATQPVLDWKFRTFQTHGTACFRCGSLRLLNQFNGSLLLKGKVCSIFRDIAAICLLSAFFCISVYLGAYSPPPPSEFGVERKIPGSLQTAKEKHEFNNKWHPHFMKRLRKNIKFSAFLTLQSSYITNWVCL